MVKNNFVLVLDSVTLEALFIIHWNSFHHENLSELLLTIKVIVETSTALEVWNPTPDPEQTLSLND